MDLTTRCPKCGTVFSASLEQLQLRKGYVRCVQCAHIFDGYDAVVPADDLPAVSLATATHTAAVPSVSVSPVGVLPAGDSTPVATSATATRTTAVPSVGVPPVGALPVGGSPSIAASAHSPSAAPAVRTAPAPAPAREMSPSLAEIQRNSTVALEPERSAVAMVPPRSVPNTVPLSGTQAAGLQWNEASDDPFHIPARPSSSLPVQAEPRMSWQEAEPSPPSRDSVSRTPRYESGPSIPLQESEPRTPFTVSNRPMPVRTAEPSFSVGERDTDPVRDPLMGPQEPVWSEPHTPSVRPVPSATAHASVSKAGASATAATSAPRAAPMTSGRAAPSMPDASAVPARPLATPAAGSPAPVHSSYDDSHRIGGFSVSPDESVADLSADSVRRAPPLYTAEPHIASEPELSDTASGVYVEPRQDRSTRAARSRRAGYFEAPDNVMSSLSGLFLGGCLCIAVAVLAVQLAYVYRAQLANQFPELRPTLESLCVQAGCTVPYAREIRQIVIVSSALRTQTPSANTRGASVPANAQAAADAGRVALHLVMRNTYDKPQEWPTLVLTLTDFAGALIARKKIAPAQYLPADLLAQPFAAGAEVSIRLPLNVNAGVRINGYQIDKFFQ